MNPEERADAYLLVFNGRTCGCELCMGHKKEALVKAFAAAEARGWRAACEAGAAFLADRQAEIDRERDEAYQNGDEEKWPWMDWAEEQVGGWAARLRALGERGPGEQT